MTHICGQGDDMKELNGAQWKAFYQDKAFWPESGKETRIHDDVLIHLNGEPSDLPTSEPGVIKDTDILTIESGFVATSYMDYVTELDAYFELWLRAETSHSFVVTCSIDKADSIKKAVTDAGGYIQ